MFIDIVRSNEKNIVVGVIYRPPHTNVDAFVSKQNEIVEKLSRENKLCYLLGDFNLNLLNHGNHQATGVVLNDCLSWKSHISLVAHKISKSIGIIYRSSYFLSKTTLRTLYNSMVLPYLYYCNLVWGSTYKSNLKRLTILQKRAIRIVSRSGCDAHTDPIFKEFKFLKITIIYLLQLGTFMYSFSTGNLPPKFDSFFLS